MKNILFFLLLISTIPLGFSSCNDFLEKPPSTEITEDTIFSNVLNAKKMLYTLYSGIPYGLPKQQGSTLYPGWRSMLSATTDEGDGGPSWAVCHQYHMGALNASNVNGNADFNYSYCYKVIRYCWKFIERIVEVPDATNEEKKQFTAEAKMILAMQYYELMIRLGGVPYVDHAYTAVEDWSLSRLPLSELVNKIDALIDEAMVDLPEDRPGEEQGRMTQEFGYFLRARLKMAIARPLFNTGTPYLSMKNPADNQLICMGTEDRERYKQAADACKSAIMYLENRGHRLLQAEDVNGSGQDAYSMACKTMNHENPEMIYYTMKAKNINSKWNAWVAEYGPRVEGNGMLQPTENFKRKFQLNTGKAQTEENGYNPQKPYEGLDPRFYACYIYNGSLFGANYYSLVLGDNLNDARKYDPNKNSNWMVGRASTERCRTGYHLRKLVHEEVYMNPASPVTPIWPYMRLAELYLMYAEALNEYYQGPNDPGNECYSYLNKVRTRCGMPAVSNLTYEEMKETIEYEWMAEFAFEGHRFFNMRQWKKAEVFAEPILSFNISRNPSNKYEFNYSTSKLEDRIFETKFYLYPFPLSEIDMNYGLIQNPGWE